MFSQLLDLPTIAAEDQNLHAGLVQRIALAGECLDKRGFTTTVRTQDCNVLTGTDGEIQLMQDDLASTCYFDVLKLDKFLLLLRVRRNVFGACCSIFQGKLPSSLVTLCLMADPALPSLAIPKGFRFAATRAGIKASGRTDLACIVTNTPAATAAMFTSNQVFAAPIQVGRQHLERNNKLVRAVVVNAGNANCVTGAAGLEACEQTCVAVARHIGCEAHEVVPSSTGIIGVLLPVEKIVAALPAMMNELGNTAEHFMQFATAIMTTDTRPKVAHATAHMAGADVRILGTTKGAGMIQPRLVASPAVPHATMLAYVVTDAGIAAPQLQDCLQSAVDRSFNRISIDGDMSTNDTVLLLASGSDKGSREEDLNAFQAALDQVCQSLAKQMVADGEGAGHLIELHIKGARSDDDALMIARSVSNSPLVKTAWAGTDPNWGRILAAIGYAGVPIDPGAIDVFFGDLPICESGGLSPDFDKDRAHGYLQQGEYSIDIDLHMGPGSCRFWTCDLTSEYVKINADYST